MTGIKQLDRLLAQISPEMGADEYIFATFTGAKYADLSHLSPIASFQEKEGLTLVIERTVGENAQIPFDSRFKKISLQVHSSLDAVGLTAAVSGVLAQKGISANIMAAYFHDHIFVPSDQAEEALAALKDLS